MDQKNQILPVDLPSYGLPKHLQKYGLYVEGLIFRMNLHNFLKKFGYQPQSHW